MSQAGLFPSVRSVGGLLPTDVLVRIQAGATGGLPGLRGEDFGLAAGETIENAAARAWPYLLTTWTGFRTALAELPEGDHAVQLTRQRWLLVLLRELGFGTLATGGGVQLDERTHVPLSHEWQDVPLHLLGWNVPLDSRSPGVAGAATASPQSMIQELLNRSDERLWALLSNGRLLRLLRDSTALVGAAYVEFDLEAMFDGELFPDFRLLFTLCHASRFTPPATAAGETEPAGDCWLERWRAEAIRTGVRALAQLGAGVEQALHVLGTGFLSHPDNVQLRNALADGGLTPKAYHHGLLRLVYRMLFLFVIEEREVLHPQGCDPVAARRYADFYSGTRLRRLSRLRHGSSHDDLWQGLHKVLEQLGGHGEPRLGLPALAGLFDPTPDDLPPALSIANDALLTAVRALSWVRDPGGPWRPVDYRHLGAEELGSIYESLLELVADADAVGHREFRLRRVAGNERKTTGSYFTPADLIALVLDEALDPLLDEAVKEAVDSLDAEHRLLALTICDPACGSGHFLVAAARRIARRVAMVRTQEAEPPPEVVREALHDVVERCIYGVDVEPLAAELAKVSLWLEAAAPGRPLSYLDAHVKSGNSLLGTTPSLLRNGIPDAAFVVLTGDDGRVAAELKRANAEVIARGLRFAGLSRERSEQGSLFETPGTSYQPELPEGTGDGLEALRELQARQQANADEVRKLAERYRQAQKSSDVIAAKAAADAWCAAFVQPKPAELYERIDGVNAGITSRTIQALAARGPSAVAEEIRDTIDALSGEYRFFHWHLEFPEIFRESQAADGPGWEGGFSCTLGNPPWERVKLQDKEFFAAQGRDDIANAGTAAKRKRAIEALRHDEEGRVLYEMYLGALRRSEGAALIARASGRYPLCGRGDINTYSVFAETFRTIVAPHGQAGVITPTGLATDNTTAAFFSDVIERRALVCLYDFVTNARIWQEIGHGRMRFVVLVMAGVERPSLAARFAFFCNHPDDLVGERVYALSPEELLLLNPNTRNSPILQNRRDADLLLEIYRRHPVLINEASSENPWGLSFMTMFHMANDSGLFRGSDDLVEFDGWSADNGRLLPLYEAKLLYFYDHRLSSYALRRPGSQDTELPRLTVEMHDDPEAEPMARYWVDRGQVDKQLAGRWDRGWLLGWRDIARATDARTFVPCVLPRSAVGHVFPLAIPREPAMATNLHAIWSSLIFDYIARQKISGTHMTYGVVQQLACPAPETFRESTPWSPRETFSDWVQPRVLELSYTSWRLKPYAEDNDDDDPPFRWLHERRELMRAELDAAMFHVYGLGRDEVAHVLDSFLVLLRNEERDHGEFRTKRLVLDEFDRMTSAIAGGGGWISTLDPVPGCGPRHVASRSRA